MSEAMQQIQSNIKSIERIWWRYGLPAIIVAWATVGFAAGLVLGLAIGGGA